MNGFYLNHYIYDGIENSLGMTVKDWLMGTHIDIRASPLAQGKGPLKFLPNFHLLPRTYELRKSSNED